MPVIDLFHEHQDRTLRPTVLEFSLDDTRPETIRQVLWFSMRLIESPDRWAIAVFRQLLQAIDPESPRCDPEQTLDLITTWNDASTRTRPAVVNTFRTAIDALPAPEPTP